MSKEEFLKIQTCVLKVNIHCDGCKHKVKKILQKIEGVYTTKIDAELGKVTVSGNINASTLIKKLEKNGKHAEIWGAQKSNNNSQNKPNNQFNNLQINNGKGGNNKNKEQAQQGGGCGNNKNNNHSNNQQKGGGNNNNQAKGGQNSQLQPMKGFQDMKMGQLMKDMKAMSMKGKDQNAKSVKFKIPEDDGMSDDDFDDDDDDDEFDDDDLEDDMDDGPLHKMKPVMGNGTVGMGMPNMMHNMMNSQNPHLGKGGGNGKKGGDGGCGGGNIPVQMNHGGGGNAGKKGGKGNNGNNNGGGNQNQNQGVKGGKNGGGNSGQGKNGGGGNFNGANKAGGMTDGHGNNGHGMASMMGMGGPHMGNMPITPMGQMGNLMATQGLPASATMGGGGGPYHPHQQQQQQQLAAMMMNQQRANGNERFHPMMYARPPPAVNYLPPYSPYHDMGHNPYPPPGERVDQYSMFSDENTSSCAVM